MVHRGNQSKVTTNVFFFQQIVIKNIESHAAVKRTSVKPKTMIVPNDQMNFTRNDLTHLKNGYRFKVIIPSIYVENLSVKSAQIWRNFF